MRPYVRRPCDVEQIQNYVGQKTLFLSEDVCQAESFRYKGRMLGSFADMAAFSFLTINRYHLAAAAGAWLFF